MESQIFKIKVKEKDRLDVFISHFLKEQNIEFSRNKVQKLIINSKVKVNNQISLIPKMIVKENDNIELFFEYPVNKTETEIIPLNYKLDILYEDEDIIVVNKPNNMVVHQSFGHEKDTLVNALAYHTKQLSNLNGADRLGIVHRIDKQTTGLLVVAKTDQAMLNLQEQIKKHIITREYQAIVHGVVKYDQIKIEGPIGRDEKDRKKMAVTSKNSRDAVTNLEVIERFNKFTLVKLILETGRTHQIRVHLKYIQHPILGDHKYGQLKDKNSKYGQYLHAYKLSFMHPVKNKVLTFNAELPDFFNDKLVEIK
ncbi:RluA family pseudouridine synthase [Spiroplasma endosymbiont of Amphibalanus improvisus]|uniref:RluA family pseudouridine synthase n=1 Tax=Spiroplasma endosymbiont of Amphibalanus improvisus TaxID=3066327 RepID=UPI00313E4417